MKKVTMSKVFTEDKLNYIVPYIKGDKAAWYSICEFQKLSTNFMEKYYKHLNKRCISIFQKLEEDLQKDLIRKLKGIIRKAR